VRLRYRTAAGLSGLALAAGLIAGTAPAGATTHGRAATGPVSIRPSGTGHGVLVRSVNVRAAASGPQIAPHPWNSGPLGRNGKEAGSTLPTRPSTGAKPHPAGPAAPATPPSKINASFAGMHQGGSNCGSCQPPDPNAAVGATRIAHVVNLRLQVYTKSGTSQCGIGLNTLLGTGARLSDPHILYDNINKRFFMVVIPVPATDSDTPTEFLLATRTADPCGSWFVYTVMFHGGPFPAGTLMDYPYLGQDNVPSSGFPAGGAILSSTNDFCCSSNNFRTYENSEAFAIPKHPVFHGMGFSFSTFGVDFSTAPVTQGGIPTTSTSNTYWLASVPGFGYDLFVMTHSSDPTSTTLALQDSISAPFKPPSRRVNQPGTKRTLDPLDGRIDWTPTRAGKFIWFTHGIDRSGFPSVRYGTINVSTNAATVASAFHGSTSDDFNPSIAVFPAASTTVFAWLNWAYTNTPQGVPTTVAVNGLLPTTGIHNLIGTDKKIITGTSTSNFRFGDFSSVEVDPVAASSTCAKGRTAVMAQEYFNGSGWLTRVVRASFC